VDFYFSFKSFSFQVHNPIPVRICLPFLASGPGEHVSSILPSYDGNHCISPYALNLSMFAFDFDC